MARLLPSSSGVVQQLCNQFVSQCSCLNALQHLAQSQPTPWAASSSSSSGGGGMPVQQQRHKSTVRMVLLKDHEHLGSRGDIVEVKAGYARHDLFPKGEADYAVPSVIRQLKVRAVVSSRTHRVQCRQDETILQHLPGGHVQDRAASQQDCTVRPCEAQQGSHSSCLPVFIPVSPPVHVQERGLLSAQALEQLQPGAKKQAARGPDDPSTLPLEQQLPQIIRLLNKQPLVRQTTAAAAAAASFLTAAVLGERHQCHTPALWQQS